MRRIVAAVVTVAVVGAACGGGDSADESDTFASGSEVVVATANDLLGLDPQANQDYPGRIVYGNIFESLLTRGADGDLEPQLAAGMPVAVDPTTWEVTLRPDVTWQDGSPLTAADVAYSINRVIDPEYRTQQATLFSTIAGADVVDDQTVRIRTEAPDPILDSRLALLLIVKENDADRPDFEEKPIGTGPYEFVERDPGSETVVEHWDGYREELPDAPERLVLRVIPEPRTQVAALERGEVDIVPALSPDDVELVPRAEAVSGTETMLLRLDARDGVLADASVREAINLAVNREEIVDALFSGYAEPATCQIAAPGVFGHDADLPVPEYDPDRARELLGEAGAEGTRIDMSAPGTRFAKGREVAQAVAQQLEDVGFTVNLDFPSDQVAAGQLTQPPRHPNIFMYSSNTEFFDETKQLQWLTSDGQFSGADDPDLDALAEAVEQELDPTRREQLFAEINERACETLPNVYLYVAQDIYGMSDDVDWQPRADGLIVAADIRLTES